MVGVGRQALAQHLAVDLRTALGGVLGGLQDHDARTLAEDEPVPAGVDGRDAFSGSSLLLDIAIMLANAAIGSGWIAASVPPATTTSARPVRIISTAYPSPPRPRRRGNGRVDTGLGVDLQADVGAGPLGMNIGTVCGETRRTPFP
ncbi:hypothetical protein SCALM49S_08783 [Streptomyces californicus]